MVAPCNLHCVGEARGQQGQVCGLKALLAGKEASNFLNNAGTACTPVRRAYDMKHCRELCEFTYTRLLMQLLAPGFSMDAGANTTCLCQLTCKLGTFLIPGLYELFQAL